MPQAEANVVTQNLLVSTSHKEITVGATRQGYGVRQLQGPEPRFGPSSQKLGLGLGPGLTENLGGLGPGPPGAWGPGPRAAGPESNWAVFRRSEKSPGRGLAKGWESAETAAAGLPPRFWAVREKRRGFSPSPLLKPSNTPPKVGG